uniref:Uncharacterized protein n=1 Tax=viral metagenome TaxID=1070528 RepID=A0A6C0J5M5_9ZZZZ
MISYDVLSFVDEGINGTGPLESYVPKGVICVTVKKNGVITTVFGLHLQSDILTVGWDLMNCINGKQTLSEAYSSFRWDNATFIRHRQLIILKKWIKEKHISTKRQCILEISMFLTQMKVVRNITVLKSF